MVVSLSITPTAVVIESRSAPTPSARPRPEVHDEWSWAFHHPLMWPAPNRSTNIAVTARGGTLAGPSSCYLP